MTRPGEDQERFRVEVTIGAPIDAVWRALRDPAEIRRWHGWHFDGLDDEIDIIYRKDFTESAAEHWLELQGGDRFELTDVGGRTRLRLTRAPRGGDPYWDAYYEDICEGWITFIHQLKFALERHPGSDRRTVFRAGASRNGRSVLAASGLAALAGLAVGARYTAAAPVEQISGEVWFRSPHQLGLTVDEWGDGLLIVGDQPPSGAHPDGGAMAVLTTYGFDEPTHQRFEARWEAWWNAEFDAPPQPATGG
jgi:hypothetical protein